MTPLDPQVLTELSRISSPTIANAIETFNVKPWNTGFVSERVMKVSAARTSAEVRSAALAGAVSTTA